MPLLLLALPALAAAPLQAPDPAPPMRVHFIDVGQGVATLVAAIPLIDSRHDDQ